MVVLVDREEGRGLERRRRGEVKEQQWIVEEDYQRVDCQHMELREIRNTEQRTRENNSNLSLYIIILQCHWLKYY